MKVSSFFKILNRKINKDDKLAANPFTLPKKIVVVWIEDAIDIPYPAENFEKDNY